MFSKLTDTVSGRIFTAGFLVIILMIPLGLVKSTISEREGRQQQVIHEIASKWGQSQSITGPLLLIPVKVHAGKDKWGNATYARRFRLLLPEKLNIDSEISTFIRKRGLFETPLYKNSMHLSGYFNMNDLKELRKDTVQIYLSEAVLIAGFSDARGLVTGRTVFNSQKLSFLPGTAESGLGAGIHAPVSTRASGKADFSLQIDFQGSRTFYMSPVGKETTAELKSDWASPKFDGSYLPEKHNINSEGFTASYRVSWFGRNYPQVLSAEQAAVTLGSGRFGVEFLLTADHYQKSERSVKYGVLFLVLTFGAFFLFEIFTRLKIHPVQYLFIGISMVIFFLLLLSLSEHISFYLAYLIAAAAVTISITGYSVSVLNSGRRGMFLGGFLLLLYGFLYFVLQSEDMAMLLGSLIMFALISTAMYLTRKIDWYRIDYSRKTAPVD